MYIDQHSLQSLSFKEIALVLSFAVKKNGKICMAIRDVLSSSLGGLKKKKKSEAFFQCFYWTKAFPLSDVAVETLQVVLRFYRL